MKKLLPLMLLIASLPLAAQVVTLNDATTVVPSPKKLGMNLGCLGSYDSCQLLKNVQWPGGNPGFEPSLTNTYITLTNTGTTTTFSDYNQYGTWIPNIWAGGTFTVTESVAPGAELGCTGTIASNTGPNRVQITAIAFDGTSNTATITANNNFTAGETIVTEYLSAGSFLNNNTLTIISTGLSSTSFEATGVTHATVATTADNGWAQINGSTAFIAPVFTVSAACPAAFTAGDQIKLTKLTTPTPTSWWMSGFYEGVNGPGVSNGGVIESDTTDLCATCGTQALWMHLPNTTSTAQFNNNWDSDTANIFKLMDGTWQFSFWAKAAAGSPVLNVHLSRGTTNGISCPTFTPTLTSSWALYTSPSCTGGEVGIRSGNSNCQASGTQTACTVPGYVEITYNASCPAGGCDLYLDNVATVRTTDTNPTIFSDAVVTALQGLNLSSTNGSPVGTLRYWFTDNGFQNGTSIDNWLQPDYAIVPTGVGVNADSFMFGGQNAIPLNDYLVLCQYLGVNPYFEVPVGISTTEAANLVEFLASPSTTTYGAKRAALGQTAPWTSVFSMIYMTFCNECWNTSFAYQNIPDRAGQPNSEIYYDYSTRARDVIAAMRGDSYFSESYFQVGMDLLTAANATADVAIQRAKPDYPEIEAYAGSVVDSTTSNTDTWGWQAPNFWLWVYGPGSSDKKNMYASLQDYFNQSTCGPSGTSACYVTHYEWGQGTNNGTLTQTAQDSVDAGAGTMVTTAINPLIQMQVYKYFGPQNYFALNEFENGGGNSNKAKLWGLTVDMGGATNNVRPPYFAVQAVNAAMIGPMTAATLDSSNLYNYAGNSNNGEVVPPGIAAINNIQYVFAYPFTQGTSRTLLLANSDTVNSHTLTFAGTNVPSGTVNVTSYCPSSPNLLNEASTGTSTYLTAPTTSLSNSTVMNPSSISVCSLGLVSLAWNTGGTPPAATPTFSPAAGTYSSTQTVTISSATPGASITWGTVNPPTTAYTGPVTVSSTETIYAFATASGYTQSATGSASYTITGGLNFTCSNCVLSNVVIP